MIRKLTILRTRVRADVQIGENEFGGAVVVTVELPRNAQEVQDATVSLENLLLRTAQEHVRASSDRKQFEAAVRTAVAERADKERERLKRNAEAEWDRQRKQFERERDDAVRHNTRLANEVAQLREDLVRRADEVNRLRAQQQQGEQVTTT